MSQYACRGMQAVSVAMMFQRDVMTTMPMMTWAERRSH